MVVLSYGCVTCMMVVILMHGGYVIQELSAAIVSCEDPVPLALRMPHSVIDHMVNDEDIEIISQTLPLKGKSAFKQRIERNGANNDGSSTSSDNNGWTRSHFELDNITRHDKSQATHYGRIQFEKLKKLEDELSENGIQVPTDTAAYKHQQFRQFNNMSKTLSILGIIMDYAGQELRSRLPPYVTSIDLTLVEQNVFCGPELRRPKPESCDVFSPFRTPDGTCNNLNDPLLGASFSEHGRLLPPDYGDGVSELRRAADGGNLPSARLVSQAANLDSIRRSSCNTVLFTNFGQLTDHDFAFTPITKGTNGSTIPCCIKEVMENQNLLHPQCAPIAIPVDDPFYSAFGETCMEFVRSSPADRCDFGPREQLNEVTSFLDVSSVYGSTKSRADGLRTFTDGLLVTQLSRDGQELLGIDLEPEDGCTALETPRETLFCFKTGDVRVNEQEGLTVVSTAIAREHNRLARMLGRLNPGWDDERIYQETRRIVIAKMQHITYNEFLPLALGPALVKRLGLLPQGNGQQTDDYDPTINPRVTNEFTTAAFRFGHSMLPTNLWRINTNGTTTARELSAAFFNPFPLYMEGGATRLLLGMMQSAPKVDNIFTREVSGRLFREEKQFGLDLVAINIQRGRDHGIPGYVAVRRACGFPEVTSFSQLFEFTDPQVLQVFKKIYRNVNDIDLFAGGLAEKPLPGGLLGPTLSCIIADQFLRAKIGDRFWFEYKDSPGAFTTDQLREIHQVSMARVLCDNFPEIRTIQRWPFQVVTAFNPMLQCSSKCIPNFNLKLWKE